VRQPWNAVGCGSGLSESDLELVRSKSLPCGRKRKVAPSLGPATRAARSKCLLLAVESGGRAIASGKTALKALLLLLMLMMHTHHACLGLRISS
jgi:hypothetical protein